MSRTVLVNVDPIAATYERVVRRVTSTPVFDIPVTVAIPVVVATANKVGSVKPGNHLSVDASGTLNVETGIADNDIPTVAQIKAEKALREQGDTDVRAYVDSGLAGKQNTLTFDDIPTNGSNNPVKSGGVKDYIDSGLAGKQNTLTFDNSPTNGSTNPVQSNGVYDADAALQAQITANAGDIDTLESRVLTAEGEIDELQSDVATLESVTPAGEGTAGQVLQSAGSGNRPIWKSLGTVYTYKGSVETYENLPAFGNTTGDTYNVASAYGNYPPGTNFAWTGSDWDALGGSIDTSIFLIKDGSVAMDNGYTPNADQKIATKKYVDDKAVAAVSNAEDYADQAEADAKAYADSGLALKQDSLTEGDGIIIEDGVISSYASYSIRETINDAVSVKQDVLTAGSGITIENNGVPVPIAIGDTLSVLFFDTSIIPDFSLFDWDNPDEYDEYDGTTKIFHLIKDSNGNSIMFAYYAPSVDLYVIIAGDTGVYAYSSTSRPYDVDLDNFGWQVDSVELSDVPVGYVSKQSSIWGSYISTLEFPHVSGAVINATEQYNDLNDKPIINQDLDGTFTAAANTYYRHTGTTGATYTQGVVYYYDGSTYTAVTGSGGGGLSGVKIVNTVLTPDADGVVTIPAASGTTNGVVTTGAQNFKGDKSFDGKLILKNSSVTSETAYIYRSSASTTAFKPSNVNYTSQNYAFYGGAKSITFSVSSSGKRFLIQNATTGQLHILGENPSGSPYWIETYTPLYSGTMMGKPSTYSSGSSGSLTITTAGEYEFYFVDSNGVQINIGSINIAASTASATGITTDYNQAYKLEVSAAGLVTLYNIVIGTSSTATTDTLYYRRKGI